MILDFSMVEQNVKDSLQITKYVSSYISVPSHTNEVLHLHHNNKNVMHPVDISQTF